MLLSDAVLTMFCAVNFLLSISSYMRLSKCALNVLWNMTDAPKSRQSKKLLKAIRQEPDTMIFLHILNGAKSRIMI